MDLLKEMADYFIYLIPIAASGRIIYCFICMNSDEDQTRMYQKRIRNTVMFAVFAVLVWELKDIALSYYR